MLYVPVPPKSMTLASPAGWHGPALPSLLHWITCASWLWKLKTSSLPVRWMCSHEPLGGGPTLPPKVLSLLPWRMLAFRNPPMVSQQHTPSWQVTLDWQVTGAVVLHPLVAVAEAL